MKILAALFFGLLVLAAAALALPGFIDWNAWKPEIAAAVEERTGRWIAIDGGIELRLLPSPRLSVAGARLAGSAGGADALRLDSLQVHVAPWPLLRGEVRIASVSLVRPTIALERAADGRIVWPFGAPAPAGGSGPAGGAAPPGPAFAIGLDGAEIVDGTVVLRGADGAERRIEDLDATIAADSLDGPFRANGTLLHRGARIAVEIETGRLDRRRAAPVAATARLVDPPGEAAFEGAVDFDGGPAARGRLSASFADAAAAARVLAALAGARADPPPALARPLALSLDLDASPERVRAEGLDLSLGEARLTGSAAAELGESASVEIDLELERLDLDAFGLGAAGAAAGAGAAVADPGPAGAAEEGGGFVLPADLKLDLDLSAGAIDFRGRAIRGLKFEGRLADGVATIYRFTAQLPGGADATIEGNLSAEAGEPLFDGRAVLVSDNLRAVLEWLGAPLEGVPADRLRKGAFDAGVRLSPSRAEFREWKIAVDATEIGGGLDLLLRDRPAFGLTLLVDKIDFDAYLPALGGAVAATAAAGDSGDAGDAAPAPPALGEAGAAGATSATEGPLARADAILSAFDANLAVRIEEAAFRGARLRGAALDATVEDGRIALRDLSAEDLEGASVRLAGTVVGPFASPEADLDIEVEGGAGSAAGLARLAGIEPGDVPRGLGPFALRAKLIGSPEAFGLDAGLEAAGGRLAVKGALSPFAEPPGFDLAATAAHPRVEAALARFEATGGAAGIALGAGELSADLSTRADGAVGIDATLALAGGRLAAAGTVQPHRTPPEIDLRVDFAHPDAVELARRAAPGYEPPRPGPAPAALAFAARGTTADLAIEGLEAAAGAAALSGSGRADLSGERPALALDIAAGTLDLDRWLPAAAEDVPEGGGGGGAAGAAPVLPVPVPAGGRDWSRERFDFSALRALDLSLELAAARVVRAPWIVEDLALSADLADGALAVRRLDGAAFGGRLAGSGSLDTADPPRLDLSLSVAGADVRAAALAAAGIGRAGGVLDWETRLSTAGRSEYEMVSALEGEGRVSITGGAVEGFDLPAVSERLKTLDRAVDFLALAQRALGGGETPIDSLSATYAIDGGVLRSDDIALVSPAAAGKAVAVVNLPAREVDARSRFWLVEHPNSPPIGVRHVGPFDNPRTVLDVEKMQIYILEREAVRRLGAAARRAGEGGRGLPKPREALRGVLEDLLR